MMAGKPLYDKALFETICERMEQGESLKSICRDEGMPAASTVRKWVLKDPVMSERYARAEKLSGLAQ